MLYKEMPNKQAKTVINTFMNVVGSTFFDFKTITSDNGTEFAGHEAISKITEADFYFARPYRSCDRGLNIKRIMIFLLRNGLRMR
ncbi:hypothetical protein [Piscirickettsia salmonis]|uniref:hypothetical protein n=1 Tax=Piscirickettsia salmonis TaxID=1238 RepID=UPI00138A1D8F|nr:hypothetical protein [Piscirickettsia salmonis]